MSGQGIAPMRQKIKAITDLAPTTNITEAQHLMGLIAYYRKFFPVFSDITRPLNELTRDMYHSNGQSHDRKPGLHEASFHYKPHFSLPRPR